jgi:hypothetical protein
MFHWYPSKEKIEKQMQLDQQPSMRYAVYSTKDFKTATFVSSSQIKAFAEKMFILLYADNTRLHHILIDWTPGEPEMEWPGAKAIRQAADAAPTLPVIEDTVPASDPIDLPEIDSTLSPDALDDLIPSAPLAPPMADGSTTALSRAIKIATSPELRHKLN